MKIAFHLNTSSQVLQFEYQFGEGNKHVGDKAEVDWIERLTEAKQVEITNKLSRDAKHAQMVRDSNNSQHVDEFHFVAYPMRGAKYDEAFSEIVRPPNDMDPSA